MISRDITLVAHYILDHLVPPFLRDTRWVMYPFFRLACGKYTNLFMDFKENYPFMSEEKLAHYYEKLKNVPLSKRETDLNKPCIKSILDNLVGQSVLDVACGRGALLKMIANKYPDLELCGADIICPKIDIKCVESSIYSMPFKNKAFDTVICTHALEHVKDYRKAINELLRITNKRLIIVMPKQREYRYTPDLHMHFLPYLYNFKAFIGIENAEYYHLKGDFLCIIDIDKLKKR